MKLELTNRLQKSKLFWKIRHSLLCCVDFPAFVFLWKIESRKDRFKRSFTVLARSIQSIISTLLSSTIILSIIHLFNVLCGCVAYEEAGSILSTLVTVVGVVLGLYYASLTSAASNFFMRAPKSLQEVFLSEKEGGQYTKIITITTVMGIFYLCVPAIGFPVAILDLIVMATFAIYSTVRILSIGPLSFYFIHPAKVAHESCASIMKTVKKVTYGHFGYKKDYLQKNSRDLVKKQFLVLQDLIDFSVAELEVSPAQLIQIATYLEMTYLAYVSLKQLIPTKSLWFDQSYKHKKWLLTDESTVDLAIGTGTGIRPEMEAEHNWFEATIVRMLLKLLKISAKKSDWVYAQQYLDILGSLVEQLGAELDTENISNILNSTNSIISEAIAKNRNVRSHDYLAFIESVGRLYMSATLGLHRFMEKYGSEYVAKQFLNISQKERSITSIAYPVVMSEELQQIRQLLANECLIEGKLITPNWYRQTLAMRQYCHSIVNYYNNLHEIDSGIESLFTTLKKSNPLTAIVLASRIVELHSKRVDITKCLTQITSTYQQYDKVEGLTWPKINEGAEKNAKANLERAIDDVILTMNPLIDIPKEDLQGLPDYIGQAYSYGLEAIYQAAAENNSDRLAKLFGTVLIGALKVRDDMVEETDGWVEQSKILMSTETFENLFTLSGFIKIYSELYYNPRLWEPCKTAWDTFLNNCKVPEPALLKSFIEASNYRDAQFVLKRSDHISTTWQIQLVRTIKQKGFDQDVGTPTNTFFGLRSTSKHKNPLARLVINQVITYSEMININARDLFFGVYLSQRNAAKGLEFPDRSHIMERLDREINKKSEPNDDNAR